MGNVFTYYQTSKTFEITTQCAEGIYSFTLTNQNLQTTDITTHTGFNVQQTDATGGKYNLTFSRADGSANSFDNKLVFTIKTLQFLQSDVLIYWTANTANNTYPYTEPYNITPTSYVGGSGAGDPHIMPIVFFVIYCYILLYLVINNEMNLCMILMSDLFCLK